MNTKERLPTVKCKWCGTYEVHKCGNAHEGMFGMTKLNRKQCNNTGRVCTSSKHPSYKQRWDI